MVPFYFKPSTFHWWNGTYDHSRDQNVREKLRIKIWWKASGDSPLKKFLPENLWRNQEVLCALQTLRMPTPVGINTALEPRYLFKLHELSVSRITCFSSPPKAHEPEIEDNLMRKSQHVFVVIIRGWSDHYIKRVLVYNYLIHWQVPGYWIGLLHWFTQQQGHSLSPHHLPGTQGFNTIVHFTRPHSLLLSFWKVYVGCFVPLKLHFCQYSFKAFKKQSSR